MMEDPAKGLTPGTCSVPARRFRSDGRPLVDVRAIVGLAFPLIISNALQTVLNLTDTFFMGRVSADAVAALAAVHWWVVVVIMLLSGAAIAVQPMAARAFGEGRPAAARRAVWNALCAVLLLLPVSLGAVWAGPELLGLFDLPAMVESLASDFWRIRIGGSSFGVAALVFFGFFNATRQAIRTLQVSILIVAANIALNVLFVLDLGWGVQGAALATTGAQALGFFAAFWIAWRSWRRDAGLKFRPVRPDWKAAVSQIRAGAPMGLIYAADLSAVGLFQIMQVRLGAVEGAATQITMMLTSFAYLPGVGIALAGTSLVAQSIGAGDLVWAKRIGSAIIALTVCYMSVAGVVLAFAGPVIVPMLLDIGDPRADDVYQLCVSLLYFAILFQMFDGFYLGSAMSLRGAGDALIPALTVLASAWLVFIPLVHTLTFGTGDGLVPNLPQAGWGVAGGWIALIVHVFVIGSLLLWRWRSGAWLRVLRSGGVQ